MAPYIHYPARDEVVPMVNPTSKSVVLDHDNVPKPVADNFMYDFKYNHRLPTTDILGVEIPADCDAQKAAEGIVARLSEATSAQDAQAFTGLFLDYGDFFFRMNSSSGSVLTLYPQESGVTSYHLHGTSARLISEKPS